ncbi:hypothetical protein RhiirA5_386373 [Rhizophagus irregularis]|uniref:Uncharacterized protein n=1 Tax=Rhizophagus irregularis TaxID=588596 RepID=A0A2N0NK05_9GLOM|nr:hypothetical protein RhiirA5_386373 [Rhizophagus irregularis]
MRANVMKNKMTGRFIPVPANNPYNENSAINTEAEFLNWLQVHNQLLLSVNVPLQKQYVPPNPQNNKSQHYLELIAEYFGYPDDHPRKPENLFNFIETEFNEIKKKVTTRTKKQQKNSKKLEKPVSANGAQNIFRSSFKSLIGPLVSRYPKEILLEILLFINRQYTGLKDQPLSHFLENYSTKEKEKAWEHNTAIYTDLLHPLVEAVIHFQTNSKAQQVNESALQNQQNSTNNERTLPEVEMKSNRAKKMDAVSNQQFPILSRKDTLEASNNTLNQATKKYQQRNNIKHSRSNINCEQCSSILSDIRNKEKNLVNKRGLEIDKNNISEIAVIRNSAKTIGASYNLPITLEQGVDRIEITDDFPVIEEDNNEPFVLLGTPWLYRAGWQPIVN